MHEKLPFFPAYCSLLTKKKTTIFPSCCPRELSAASSNLSGVCRLWGQLAASGSCRQLHIHSLQKLWRFLLAALVNWKEASGCWENASNWALLPWYEQMSVSRATSFLYGFGSKILKYILFRVPSVGTIYVCGLPVHRQTNSCLASRTGASATVL